MGNCQAAEAACVVIQHPGGKVERLYAPSTAGDVMRGNPGHYVALVVLRVSGIHAGAAKQRQDPAIAAVAGKGRGATRITKVKLLKPKDALLFGQVYRLITSQEVAKAIQARRQDKTRRCEDTAADDSTRRRPGHGTAAGSQEQGQQATHRPSATERKRPEKDRHHRSSGRGGRPWQPSLQSITEFPS